mmetsp:Transcript_928/g.2365  ORF Transcript_928/g.2365 Transcript_928/m.2365 type:complete len:131 (+) Transcript_928:883-1275(+)
MHRALSAPQNGVLKCSGQKEIETKPDALLQTESSRAISPDRLGKLVAKAIRFGDEEPTKPTKFYISTCLCAKHSGGSYFLALEIGPSFSHLLLQNFSSFLSADRVVVESNQEAPHTSKLQSIVARLQLVE